MDSIEGFILVGGESRRMGTDKSRLVVKGESFVQRIARNLSAITSSVGLVGTNPLASQEKIAHRFSMIQDVHPGWGALGGVHTALSACSANWAMVVACDFPFVTGELFVELASFREGFEAVAPIQSDQIPQPLCALYRVAPCLARADQLIEAGERKPIALLQSVRTRWVLFSELAHLVNADRFFDNINTPEDYARIAGERISS